MRAVLVALLLVACAEPCSPTHPDTAALLAECKLRVLRECPTLQRGECPIGEPCPQCPAIEECDAATREVCQ